MALISFFYNLSLLNKCFSIIYCLSLFQNDFN